MAQEWGSSPIITARRRLGTVTELKQATMPGYYRVRMMNLRPDGVLEDIPTPRRLIDQIATGLPQYNADPIYIKVEGPNLEVVFRLRGSPSIYGIVLGLVAMGAIVGALYLVLGEAMQETILELPLIGPLTGVKIAALTILGFGIAILVRYIRG